MLVFCEVSLFGIHVFFCLFIYYKAKYSVLGGSFNMLLLFVEAFNSQLYCVSEVCFPRSEILIHITSCLPYVTKLLRCGSSTLACLNWATPVHISLLSPLGCNAG